MCAVPPSMRHNWTELKASIFRVRVLALEEDKEAVNALYSELATFRKGTVIRIHTPEGSVRVSTKDKMINLILSGLPRVSAVTNDTKKDRK